MLTQFDDSTHGYRYSFLIQTIVSVQPLLTGLFRFCFGILLAEVVDLSVMDWNVSALEDILLLEVSRFLDSVAHFPDDQHRVDLGLFLLD